MPHGRSATDSRMPFLHEPLLSGAFKAAEAQRSTLGRNQDRLVQLERLRRHLPQHNLSQPKRSEAKGCGQWLAALRPKGLRLLRINLSQLNISQTKGDSPKWTCGAANTDSQRITARPWVLDARPFCTIGHIQMKLTGLH